MKLYESIKEIVKNRGIEVIKDSSLLNILNDYHAFEDRPAAKLVLRDIINGGYSEKILRLNKEKAAWEVKIKSFEHDFVDSCGYKEELVLYVFQSLSYGIGLTDKKPGEGMDEILDFHPFFDDSEEQEKQEAKDTTNPKTKADTVDDKDYLKIAQDFIDSGKLDTARSIAEKISNGSASVTSDTIKATLMLGHIMRKKGQYKEALDYYNQALNDEAKLLNVGSKNLQQQISNRKISGFADVDIHYMYCLYEIRHIDNNRWTNYVRGKASKGNFVAMMYCAQFGISPQTHVDIFFTDYKLLREGDYLYEDGSFAHESSDKKGVVGCVFSLQVSEVEKQLGWTHGRVMACPAWRSSDSDYYQKAIWGPAEDLPFPHTHYTIDDLNHIDQINSKLYSELLIKDLYDVPGTAFYAARNWRTKTPLKGTSNWYLPNYIQAEQMTRHLEARLITNNKYGQSGIWTSTQVDRYTAVNGEGLIPESVKKSTLLTVVPIFSF